VLSVFEELESLELLLDDEDGDESDVTVALLPFRLSVM
jgi:hypothetical protein